MSAPAPRGTRRSAIVLLVLAMVVSAFGSALLPSGNRIAFAAEGVALGDTLILAGPGGQYGILTVAPTGSVMSVDGDPVDGYYPVTFDGVSGWTAAGLLQVTDNGGGGGGDNGGGNGDSTGNGGGGGGNHDRTRENGNGGTETVSADPVFSDNGEPVGLVPTEPEEAAPASTDEPVTGGTYGPGGAGYSEDQIIDIIYEAADNYGQSRDDMLRVARCESGLDPHAVGGGGSYHGLYQFVPSTFSGTPYGEYDIYDPWANANAASWLWSEGHQGDWVCQ